MLPTLLVGFYRVLRGGSAVVWLNWNTVGGGLQLRGRRGFFVYIIVGEGVVVPIEFGLCVGGDYLTSDFFSTPQILMSLPCLPLARNPW